MTHWLQAQDPRLASDRVLPNPTLSGSQTEVLVSHAFTVSVASFFF